MTPAEYWSGVFKAYEIYRKGYPRLDPLVQLAHTMSTHCDGESLYPSMSHAALGISAAEHYAMRLEQPMVYIDLAPDSKDLEVHFQLGQGRPHLKETFAPLLDETVLQRIFAWVKQSE